MPFLAQDHLQLVEALDQPGAARVIHVERNLPANH
jgi:hypothetical protein